MIDISALRKLIEAGESYVIFDARGNILDRRELAEVGRAVLIATPLTDAVKLVVGGLVQDSLDRDTLWSIEGFGLGREVMLAVDESVATPEALIDAVTRAGFEWQVISPSSSLS